MIDKLDRLTMQRPEAPTFYGNKVQDIALALGGWSQTMTDNFNFGPGTVSIRFPTYRLTGPDPRFDVIDVEIDTREYGRLIIGACTPADLQKYNIYNLTGKSFPSIGISANRSAQAIAQDIKRRLFPISQKQIAQARESLHHQAEENFKWDTVLDEFAKLSPRFRKYRSPVDQSERVEHRSIGFSRYLSGDLEISSYQDGEVRFERFHCPLDLGMKLAKVIAEYVDSMPEQEDR